MFSLEMQRSFSENGGFMGTSFTPSKQDVERYRRLRALNMDLNHRMIKTIPRHAYDEVGDAIGIRQNGVLVFDSMDMSSVLMDCCLYDWFEHGKNVVQRYAKSHPAKPRTDESFLLSACVQAKYRILMVRSTVSGSGLRCHDVLNNEDLFVMDLGLSRSLPNGKGTLATRTIPFGEYSITSGAGLPINSEKTVQALSRLEGGPDDMIRAPGRTALLIVRACLATGAADHVMYETPESKTEKTSARAARWWKFKRHS